MNSKPCLDNKFFISKLKLLGLVFILITIGICMLYSAAGGEIEPWALKQLYTALFMIPCVLIIVLIDPIIIYRNSYFIYLFFLIFLIIAEIVGHTAMGAQRWLRVGGINFQPSEFMKIGLILALARYFQNLHSNQISGIYYIIMPLLIVLLPTILILKQPNLGTTVIILIIATSIFFSSGVKIWKFLLVIFTGLTSIPIIWLSLHQYQKQRILTFLNPEQDPLGAGYNIIQSQIAIGSGGAFGKGFLNGSQNQLSFLPEKQTDFIFTVLAEEFGLVGVLAVLTLYLAICIYCYYISFRCRNQYGRLVCVGVSTMLFIHVFINVAMISGLLPVVGTPLPFLSFGRSNLITCLIGIALVLNVYVFKDRQM